MLLNPTIIWIQIDVIIVKFTAQVSLGKRLKLIFFRLILKEGVIYLFIFIINLIIVIQTSFRSNFLLVHSLYHVFINAYYLLTCFLGVGFMNLCQCLLLLFWDVLVKEIYGSFKF